MERRFGDQREFVATKGPLAKQEGDGRLRRGLLAIENMDDRHAGEP
jgi:hypothetical protein